jgi:hypothetical protein
MAISNEVVLVTAGSLRHRPSPHRNSLTSPARPHKGDIRRSLWRAPVHLQVRRAICVEMFGQARGFALFAM